MKINKDVLNELVDASSIAYSHDRYANWKAVCAMLLRKGFTPQESEAILRSKWTRWAGDISNNRYGHCTSKDLERFMDGMSPEELKKEVAELLAQTPIVGKY